MKAGQSLVRRLRRWLASLFAATVIALAVAMALGQLLLPLLASSPDRVAAFLSRRLHQPVAVQSAQGHWQASGPLLTVAGLRIGSGDNALRLPAADLKVDFGAWLKRDRRWLELRISDASAHLLIDRQGAWHLSGVELGGGAASGTASQLADLPVGLLVRNLRLTIRNQQWQRTMQLDVPALRALTRGNRLHLGGRLRQPGGGASLELAASINLPDASGTLYLAGANVDLAAWDAAFSQSRLRLRRGHGSLRLWLDWRNGRPQHLAADVDLADLEIGLAGQAAAVLPRWHGLLKIGDLPNGWQAHWQAARDDAAHDPGSLWIARDTSGRIAVQAQQLDLGLWAPWLALWPADSQPPPRLARLRPWGLVQDLRLDWRSPDDFSLAARLQGLGWKAGVGLPGVDHLDLQVRGDGEAVSAHVPGQAVTISYPGVFRQPFEFSRVSGDWTLWRGASGWKLASDNMQLVNEGYTLRLRGGLQQAPDRPLPVLDVTARVIDAHVPAAKQFWPVNVMPPDAVSWLDRALVSGDASGRALFRGNLADWPFAQHHGRFEAVADFRNTVLDYDPDWPVADALDGRATFVNLGMRVTTSAGRSLGNAVESASAEIAHFDHAELALAIRGHGRAGSLLDWLRKTPVGQEHQAALAALQVAGGAAYTIKLNLPLHDDPGARPLLDGRVTLADVRFRVPDWSLELQHLRGPLRFDTGGIQAQELTADYNGVPVQLQARIGDATRRRDASLESSMHGRFDAASLLKAWPDLAWLGDFAAGQAVFDVGLSLRTDPASGKLLQQLSVDSSLDGMALKLPAPLRKPAEGQSHLHVELGLPLDGARLSVRLAGIVDANLRLASASQPLSADVALGGSADVPPPRGIRVHGTAPSLDISGWLARMLAAGTGSPGGGAGAAAVTVHVRTPQAVVSDQSLGALALDVVHADDAITIALDGPALAGRIQVPRDDVALGGLTMRMDRLYWPDAGTESDKVADAQSIHVAPAAIPPLHVWVKDLRLGQARLGDVRLETVPVADGMQIELFEAQSPDLKLSARGNWLGDAARQHSRFSMDLSAADMGRMLAAFGYPKLVAGGTTLVHVDGSWPGSPPDFELATLEGNLEIHATDGRILEVEPGMGRLFGLFSIRELPRRLSLDFGDIFQSGYSFNTIQGKFRFADGNAWTDNLEMQGPSADITVVGRTGVRQHDYDQLIVVTPHLGVALPVVGAIAGGPIGVAAGLAMQGLLGKGINRAGEVRYKVTGSWEHPQIDRLSRAREGATVPVSPASDARAAKPSVAATVPVPAATRPAPPETAPPSATPATAGSSPAGG